MGLEEILQKKLNLGLTTNENLSSIFPSQKIPHPKLQGIFSYLSHKYFLGNILLTTCLVTMLLRITTSFLLVNRCSQLTLFPVSIPFNVLSMLHFAAWVIFLKQNILYVLFTKSQYFPIISFTHIQHSCLHYGSIRINYFPWHTNTKW